MGGILIDVVIVVCVFWVFFDAANNKIGTYVVTDGIQKGYRKGLHPVIWGILCLLIFPFFLYLFRRSSLISTAKNNPAETDKSKGFIVLFVLVAMLLLYNYRDILF
jgi:hypothetical protein